MTHIDKIQLMLAYCASKGLTLELEGECGFGRECVGVLANDKYPSYNWYDKKTWERVDKNGEVWTPKDAYHKHACVAVLGRGEEAESQLYEWLCWFELNNFVLETGSCPIGSYSALEAHFGKDTYSRMVKAEK